MQFFYVFVTIVALAVLGCQEKKSTRDQGGARDTKHDQVDQDPNQNPHGQPGQPGQPGYPPPHYPYPGDPTPPNGNGSDFPPPDPNANAECYKGHPLVCEVELEILRQTNELRAQSGKPPLEHSARIAYVSRTWSTEQAKRGGIGHSGFPSARASVYENEFQQRAALNAENVAMSMANINEPPAEIARIFTRMWWNSSGHRRNMLGSFRKLGAGVHIRTDGYVYGTQIFGDD